MAEPGRRIGEQGIEGHLGRPDERRVDAELRRDDPDLGTRRRQGVTLELGLDSLTREGQQPGVAGRPG